MNRSQLRRLARDYATGRLEYDEYARERGDIIDGIESGAIVIESTAETTGEFSTARTIEHRIRATPLPLIVGACVLIVAIWMFLVPPRTSGPPSGDATKTIGQAGTRVSAARKLVEDFLATRDWSSKSLGEFRDSWNALTPNEQAEARAAPWFRRLAEALREEINAHKALAEFDGSGLSTTTGRRLASFGEFLGIDAELPDPATPERRPPPAVARPTGDEPKSASQWLATQNDDDYTLQLFAVNRLERLERLIAAHPDVALHLLGSAGDGPRYRLVHGAFASEAQARSAHAALPEELRGDAPRAFVRRFGDLREEMSASGEPPAMNAAPAPQAETPVYTLQLFASASRENVDRLVARYGDLELRVHTSPGAATKYRVLYGRFDSREAARAASEKLPKGMIDEVGTPLLREVSEYR